MSLQLLAKQMEAKGRDGDSVLVHMTPGEVEGLQKLAESAGGSLTVNPETGLVEANFLKRMLPTLAGIGVGMFAGPMAGAAAGALVGGMTAPKEQRNMGILMGALGGYGGAGLGAGLTSAGAGAAQNAAMSAIPQGATTAAHTAAQNAAMQGLSGAAANNAAAEASKTLMAQGFATDQGIQNLAAAEASKNFMAQPVYTQLGQGAQALGSEAGRTAFMQGMGGASGLAKTAGMAAAPAMMAEEQKQAEAPADDEMYVYDFDYGRTGADRTPVASSSERTYFQPTYSNRRKVKAADYFSAAEGGEVADAAPVDSGIVGGMSGASKAAFDYLMGNAASSAPQGIAAPAMTQTATPEMLAARSDREYIFNPATGQFIKNSAYGTGLNDVFVNPSSNEYYGSSGVIEDTNPDWTSLSDAKKAEYYRENPTMAKATQLGQKAFNLLTPTYLSGLRESLAPGFREKQEMIASGITPGYSGSSGDFYGDPSDYMGMTQSELAESGGGVGAAAGGLMSLAKGGMKSGGFVIPADVVSMVGEGNTDAGYKRIKSMVPGATAIKGKDGGQADTVKTSIEGKQPARVAHGEMYIPPETVKRMGGAKKLYAMMDRVRQQATGSKKQIRPVSLKKAMA